MVLNGLPWPGAVGKSELAPRLLNRWVGRNSNPGFVPCALGWYQKAEYEQVLFDLDLESLWKKRFRSGSRWLV
jgi:hypothetical protein